MSTSAAPRPRHRLNAEALHLLPPVKKHETAPVEVLEGLVTSRTLEKIFRRGGLTILHWRQEQGLPFVKVPGDARDTIRFRIEAVKKWAKAHNKRMFDPNTDGSAS